MRAVGFPADILNGNGPIESLYINDKKPLPQITGDQALIRIRAFGVNRVDLVQREGKYPVPPQAPDTLGIEFAGIIEELADGVDPDFKKGDEVFGLVHGGAYAEFVAVSTHMLVHKPAELSWEECAGVPAVFMTALQVMFLIGGFAEGKTILWHAGASAVSIAGQQLSIGNKASKVFATARSDEKVDFCVKELGATAAYNTKTTQWDEEILKATDGKGVDIIIDLIGPDTFAGNLNAAAFEGRIINVSILSGPTLTEGMKQPDFGIFMRKRLRYEGNGLRNRSVSYLRELRDQLVEHALPLLRKRELSARIDKVLPWTKIQEAHRLLEENKTKGKVICTIDWNVLFGGKTTSAIDAESGRCVRF